MLFLKAFAFPGDYADSRLYLRSSRSVLRTEWLQTLAAAQSLLVSSSSYTSRKAAVKYFEFLYLSTPETVHETRHDKSKLLSDSEDRLAESILNERDCIEATGMKLLLDYR